MAADTELSRRSVVHGLALVAPLVVLAPGGPTAGAATSAIPTSAGRGAVSAVRGAFGASAYEWRAAPWTVDAAPLAAGVTFTLTTGGRRVAGRRIRFSISAFQDAHLSLWFAPAQPGRDPARLGYLDLDTDAAGQVTLDGWLRTGAVPTAAAGMRPMLRAQLIGTEHLLATTRVIVR